jgi:hypothetical protein
VMCRKPQRRRQRQSRSVRDVVRFGGGQLKLDWSMFYLLIAHAPCVTAMRDTVAEARRIAQFR